MKYRWLLIPIIIIVLLSFFSQELSVLNTATGVWKNTGDANYGNRTINISGIAGTVTIYIDNTGVAHITAPNFQDLMVAEGYYEAYNRLFQMELQVLLAMGDLSQYIGKQGLSSDISMHMIGIPENAVFLNNYVKETQPVYYSYISDFVKGINDYVMSVQSNPPFEFKLLGFSPFLWNTTMCFAWQEFMSWTLTTGAGQPLQSAILLNAFGYDNLSQIWPYYPYYTQNVTMVPGDGTVNGYNLTSQGVSPSYFWNLDLYDSWYTGINVSLLRDLNPLLIASLQNISDPFASSVVGTLSPEVGSNSWVVTSAYSAYGVPMLANDPHLTLYAPSLWLPMQLTSTGINVTGWALAGLPGILIGHTKHTSWGLTTPEGNSANDFLEILKGSSYYYNGTWLPLTYYNYTLLGKQYSVAFTNNGPLIGRMGNFGISLNWNNSKYSLDLVAELMIDQSSNYTDMVNALKYWGTPPQNFALVSENSAGYITAGAYPLFRITLPDNKTIETIGSRSLMNGSMPSKEPIGNVSFQYLPQVKNPSRGFAFAPNQPTVGMNYPFPFVGGFWASGGRAQSIYHFLLQHPGLGASGMMALQSNLTDYWSTLLVPIMLHSLDGMDMNSTERAAYNLLSSWNNTAAINSTGMTLYWYYLSAIFNMSFDRIYAEHGVSYLTKPFDTSLIFLASKEPTSFWFYGNFTNISRSAFAEAVGLLSSHLGSISNWQWGKVHELEISSLTGLTALSIGPIPIWGDSHTVSVGSVPRDLVIPEPYVTVGSSLREISIPGTAQFYGVFPGGPSGNPLSYYYSNQLPYWLQHEYYNLSAFREVHKIVLT
ncbi:MAG: penicillin acylase family protein [Thermoplasmataceae archaeon]